MGGRTFVLAVAVVAGCGLPGAVSKPADVITPTQAKQFVADYWTQNEKASMANDPTLFESIEAGPALILDQTFAVRYAKTSRTLAQPRPLRKLTVYVPHQSRYPAEFAARIDTVGTDRDGKLTTRPLTFFNLFEKPSAAQPWKSTMFAVPSPTETITIAIANDGYVEQVPAAAKSQAVAPVRMGQVVADYLNAVTAGLGVDDSQLEAGSVIDVMARGERLAIEGAHHAGFTLTTQAASGPGGSHAYRSTNGGAVVFFTVSNLDDLASARSDACIVQDQRYFLPPEVPPGTYGHVRDKGLSLMLAFDPATTKGKARVLGVASVSYDYTVEPVPGPCSSLGPGPVGNV